MAYLANASLNYNIVRQTDMISTFEVRQSK